MPSVAFVISFALWALPLTFAPMAARSRYRTMRSPFDLPLARHIGCDHEVLWKGI
ncbi:hypothetical protein EDB86DRAFT_3078334 [Lactarius hatsudake]|nr:hypothetical protein EDB86DRAFT_3078334 [Lactarius hatsudake]